MARKLFKGFQQVTEGSFEAEAGYIYFVRNSANTGKTDGYLLFNGRKYGTAEEMGAVLNGRIGTLPEGYDNLVAYVNAQVSAITGEYATQDSVDAVEERVDALEAVSADTRLDALETDTHTHDNKAVLDGITSEKVASWDGVAGSADTRIEALETSATTWNNIAGSADTRIAALEAISADTRLDTIEGDYLTSNDKTAIENSVTAETAAREALEEKVDDLIENVDNVSAETRLTALETVSADTRLDALEALTASTHEHSNKSVLDGITAEKVAAWDELSANTVVIMSAYTGDDATSGMVKTYEIFQGGSSVGKIDVPKDMVVSSAEIVTVDNVKYLRMHIANSNNTVDVAVTDLAHVYTQGNGIEISGSDVISAKVVSGNGLSVDANGIAMGLADGSNAGAMSAADFTKLGTIEASAQTNVIETVKVNGTALTVTDKAVDITLPDYSGTYAPIALTGTVADNRTAFDNYTGATDTRLGNDEQVFDAYTAATDNRLDALEDDTHSHSNKSVLDGITAEKVADWDGVAGSADTRIAALEAVSADTRLDELEAVSADTRLDALEALTGDTASALQSISAADASVSVSAKANNAQTVGVAISAASGNTLSLENDGLFAGIYYDGDDSN